MFSRLFSGSRTEADASVIEHDELKKALNEGTCALVDVREPAEFRAGRIAHSMNLPLSRFDPAELPSGAPVILICRSGARSASALNRARRAGRADVRHYAGGVIGWEAKGGRLTQ